MSCSLTTKNKQTNKNKKKNPV